MSTTDVGVSDLAREHGTTVANILQLADDAIGQVATKQGIDAARGLSTHAGPGGTITLTAPLADLVRKELA